MRLVLLGAAVLALAGCATRPYDPFVSNALSPSATAQAAASDEEAKTETPDGLRCEFIREVGTRLPPREVCLPEAEWAKMRENAQEIVREIERLPVPVR